jgi:hypothetical protein
MLANPANLALRQTYGPSSLHPVPEMQKSYPARSDHRRNDVLSGGSQVATPNPLSLRAPPRRDHQASEGNHTHTRFERRDAVSTTRFTPGNLEVVSVSLPACELFKGGATTPGHQITEAQLRQSVTSQPENYIGVQQVPGQGVFHTYCDGSWIPA